MPSELVIMKRSYNAMQLLAPRLTSFDSHVSPTTKYFDEHTGAFVDALAAAFAPDSQANLHHVRQVLFMCINRAGQRTCMALLDRFLYAYLNGTCLNVGWC